MLMYFVLGLMKTSQQTKLSRSAGFTTNKMQIIQKQLSYSLVEHSQTRNDQHVMEEKQKSICFSLK